MSIIDSVILIDDYFEDIDRVRHYALNVNSYRVPDSHERWKGYRSHRLSSDNEIEKMIVSKICDTLEKETGKKVSRINAYFHCSPEKSMVEQSDFHSMKWHKDHCDFAGVIYLTPDPPQNTGTCLQGYDHAENVYKLECVENVYNRFLAYSSSVLHGPDHFFGDYIKTTRMTISFFNTFKKEKNMSDQTLLTSGTSHTMMSPEAQAKIQEIHASKQSQVSAEPAVGEQPTMTDQAVAQTVPTDENSIILGLIEYLKKGSEYSVDNKAQAEWFAYCSEWVKKKYEESGLSR